MENEKPTELTKKEQEGSRRQQRVEERQRAERRRTIKRIIKIALILIVIFGSIGAFAWYAASQPPIPAEEIISRRGLHWHPELTLYVKGEKQQIPANIGIGVVHNPIHTHDASGVIHLEFQGVVRENDVKLGHFFEAWNKDFMEFGPSVRMMVNGKENAELQNYPMEDGDKIELYYE